MWPLSVQFRQFQQFHDVDATFTCFALREEGMRKAQVSGDFPLVEPRFLPRRDQPLKNRIVLSLKRSRPRFP